MNYNTLTFWIFFTAVLLPYWFLSHKRQNALLLAASYGFYGAWDFRFLFLILLSTMIDYVGGLGVAGVTVPRRKQVWLALALVGSALVLCSHVDYKALWEAARGQEWSAALAALPRRLADFAIPLGAAGAVLAYGLVLPSLYRAPEVSRRRAFVWISLSANLVILGFFKYFDFFDANLARLLGALGVEVSPITLGLVLPAGISFYTFQAMSYTIDIYRGHAEPTTSFRDFALFVCFFPHLVAGPIMRAHTLLPQVLKPRKLDLAAWREGAVLIVVGLAKKLVIADNMAAIANRVFDRFAEGGGATVGAAEALIGLYAFAFQIYGDFSGYSAIARGVSKFLGYELVVNFDLPYLAQSPSDFWKRWHISLSSWLRDYLYIPLGGNRHGVAKQYRNLWITMLLGGLWHGANWTFVAWGAYHGALLVVYRVLGIADTVEGTDRGARVRRALRIVVMFHLTCLGWLLFRADSLATVGQFLGRLVSGISVVSLADLLALAFMAYLAAPLLVAEAVAGGERQPGRVLGAPLWVKSAACAYLLGMLLVFHSRQNVGFIYFQF
ncbi:MAG: MBOAT family protein [Deltaproteobacteria bacterium]|nr:MBOAT family protein [Deltaproteobacteria bacterium]